MTLVPIPWQPAYFLTPDTLALLEAASDRLGTHLVVVDAWRSYAEQKALYQAYLAGHGNIASNPDTGQRNHMRGAAFDLARTDAAAQAACRAVGLLRDADEPWHWNNPRWASMPIIPTNTYTASTGATQLNQEDDMADTYQIVSAAPPSTSIFFVHPGGISPVQSVDPEVIVLKSFAEQMNAGKPPVLTNAQYKLVDQVMQRRA